MSWWVMEQVSVNEAGTATLANIQCDDVSDLPAPDQSATLGYIIVRGSQAKVLATSEKYILGSTGTWVKMEDGVKLDLTGYATTQYVDDGLSAKVDTTTYTTGQAAQEKEIGVVAALGAKNAFNPADYIANSRSGVTITYNGDGTYSLSGTPTQTSDYLYTPDNVYNKLYGLQAGQAYTISTGVKSSKVLVRIIPSYDGVSYDWSRPLVNNVSVKVTFTIPDDVVGLLIDFRSTANAGSLNGIVLKPMIHPAEIADDTYVPYAPTNRELYEMILALQ